MCQTNILYGQYHYSTRFIAFMPEFYSCFSGELHAHRQDKSTSAETIFCCKLLQHVLCLEARKPLLSCECVVQQYCLYYTNTVRALRFSSFSTELHACSPTGENSMRFLFAFLLAVVHAPLEGKNVVVVACACNTATVRASASLLG